jgi:hypothetical protein
MKTCYARLTIIALTFTLFLCFFPLPGSSADLQEENEHFPAEKIALLPFDNFSGDSSAVDNVMPVLADWLEQSGFTVVGWDVINDFMCEQRVRSTGHISQSLARKLKERYNVSSVLVGAIISHSDAENPNFSITARLIDSSAGSIIWADYASATGEDFMGILGLGRINSVYPLISRVIDRLFLSFSTVPSFKETEPSHRVAVMPFQNNSKLYNVGKIAMYMFLAELVKSRHFTPIEYGNVLESIVDNRIRYKGELDFDNIRGLSSLLGVDAILVGTVEIYNDGKETQSPPESSINARLLDVRNNKILWFNSFRMNGEEDIIVFDWRRIRSVDNVAHKIVTELISNMTPELWY